MPPKKATRPTSAPLTPTYDEAPSRPKSAAPKLPSGHHKFKKETLLDIVRHPAYKAYREPTLMRRAAEQMVDMDPMQWSGNLALSSLNATQRKKVQDDGWSHLAERRDNELAAQANQAAILQQHPELAGMLGFKKGGKVKATGVYVLHKDEIVIPANRVAAVEKAVKSAGLKPLKK